MADFAMTGAIRGKQGTVIVDEYAFGGRSPAIWQAHRDGLMAGKGYFTMLLEDAEEYAEVAVARLLAPGRRADLVRVRSAVATVAGVQLGYSVSEIARRLGGRHHTTIMASMARHREFLATSSDYAHLHHWLCLSASSLRALRAEQRDLRKTAA